MADFDERVVGGLRVRIDRTLCVGFGNCVTGAEQAFVLADDGVVAFMNPELVAREQWRGAGGACPVDALTVWNDNGQQLVP